MLKTVSILIALSLVACATEPTSAPVDPMSVRAAATLTATSACDREMRCHDPAYDVDECIRGNVDYYCSAHDCDAKYDDWTRLQTCVYDYDHLVCDTTFAPKACEL